MAAGGGAHAFDAAILGRRIADDGAGGGTFAVDLDPVWSIGTRPNGGYLLAVLGHAAQVAAGPAFPHPVAATAHYLVAPEPGPAIVEVEVLRRGRATAHVRARLGAGGRHAVEALVTCGSVTGDVWWDDVAPPGLPPEEACVLLPADPPGGPVPLMNVLAERLDPATLGWALGTPAGRGELSGWVRFADGREPDPLALLLVVDCLPPATFDLGSRGWTPTLSLTAHVRAAPVPGPLRVRQVARHVAGGRVDEVCDVWDAAGRLVATGHQLAALRLPDGPPADRV